jgi:hypothetical protein
MPELTLSLSEMIQVGFGVLLSLMFKAMYNAVREIRSDLRKYNDNMIRSEQWQIAHTEAHSVNAATRNAERDAIWRELNLLRGGR